MAPFRIPQTPVDKTRLEEDLVSVSSSQSSLPRNDTDTPAWPSSVVEPSDSLGTVRPNKDNNSRQHDRKSPSPAPPHSHHLGPADVAVGRLSVSSFAPSAGHMSPLSLRALSPAASDRRLSNNGSNSGLHGWPDPPTESRYLPAPLARFWASHRPVLFVISAQLFASLMNLFARLLELEHEHALHPVQLLFIRMILTSATSLGYMFWSRVPHAPFGAPAVRGWLILRGLTGFFGIFGMWYSMMYLPLAEATAITFLTPSVAGFLAHLVLKDPFTRKEQIASFLAFVGVLLITRPFSLLGQLTPDESGEAGSPLTNSTATIIEVAKTMARNVTEAATSPSAPQKEHVTTLQRLGALGVALLGVLGASSAFTSIRAIGKRAHPLISVTYFSTWCLIVTGTTLAVAPSLGIGQPALRFGFPNTLRQWVLMLLICICGFMTQMHATKGLGLERSNRATAMVYTQMLFAAFFDRFVFGNQMDAISLLGCGMIIGGALWAALTRPLHNKATQPTANEQTDIEIGQLSLGESVSDSGNHVVSEESEPMLAAIDKEDERDEIDGLEDHIEAQGRTPEVASRSTFA